MMREAEQVTGVRCFTLNKLLKSGAVEALGATPRARPRGGLERATLGLIDVATATSMHGPGAEDRPSGRAANGAAATNGAQHGATGDLRHEGAEEVAATPVLN
jgi:hypothetical protein